MKQITDKHVAAAFAVMFWLYVGLVAMGLA